MSEISSGGTLPLIPTPAQEQKTEISNDHLQHVDDKQKQEYQMETKTAEFEKMLNDQQQITEVTQNQQSNVFDPASEISQGSVFQAPGEARSV
ncbi:MAG: hypothetical protein AAGE89_07850 [Pseudomonadota bacterium]